LSVERSIDLVSQLMRPWCLQSALAIACVDTRHSPCLATLVNQSTEKDQRSDDCSFNKRRANEANNKLDLFFQTRNGQSSKSVFWGGETVPAFIASAWAALLDHRDQMNELHRHRELVPQALVQTAVAGKGMDDG
jgi:hypothetical protein